MLGNLGGWEILTLLLLALFIFGPERLPKAISDGLKIVRKVREMARNATADLSRELGTEVTLEDLHPKTFIRKHLLSDEEQAALLRPLDDLAKNVRDVGTGIEQGIRKPADEALRTPAAPEEAKAARPATDPDAT
jgi:sec-independent protein translocase protein TatB